MKMVPHWVYWLRAVAPPKRTGAVAVEQVALDSEWKLQQPTG